MAPHCVVGRSDTENQTCFRTSTQSLLKSFKMLNHQVVAHLLALELLTVPLYNYDYIMLFCRFTNIFLFCTHMYVFGSTVLTSPLTAHIALYGQDNWLDGNNKVYQYPACGFFSGNNDINVGSSHKPRRWDAFKNKPKAYGWVQLARSSLAPEVFRDSISWSWESSSITCVQLVQRRWRPFGNCRKCYISKSYNVGIVNETAVI